MSKILVSGGLVPTTKDTLLDARTRVATFSDIANIENPARFMVITVEDTGKKYEVRKLSSKIIGGIVVENSTIDITDPEALVDLGLAEELRSEDEKARQSNESKRIEAENLRKTAEDSRKVNETNRVSAEGAREASERTRVSSEETRNANEQTRNSNESKRQTQESTRQSQESARQNNESTRNTNESARKEAESERKTEETSRRTAELSRSSAENTRVKNEQNRTAAENTRSSAEDRRVTYEAQRATNETARNNAELSREQAEGNRASTFNTLKGQMQTTIQEGQTAVAATEKATSDAQKVVDEYETKVAEQDSKITELGSKVSNITLTGIGIYGVQKKYVGIIPGRTYKIIPRDKKWSIESVPAETRMFELFYKNKSGDTIIAAYQSTDVTKELKDEYIFTAPDDIDEFFVFVRADEGVELLFSIIDVTDTLQINELQSELEGLSNYRGESITLFNKENAIINKSGNIESQTTAARYARFYDISSLDSGYIMASCKSVSYTTQYAFYNSASVFDSTTLVEKGEYLNGTLNDYTDRVFAIPEGAMTFVMVGNPDDSKNYVNRCVNTKDAIERIDEEAKKVSNKISDEIDSVKSYNIDGRYTLEEQNATGELFSGRYAYSNSSTKGWASAGASDNEYVIIDIEGKKTIKVDAAAFNSSYKTMLFVDENETRLSNYNYDSTNATFLKFVSKGDVYSFDIEGLLVSYPKCKKIVFNLLLGSFDTGYVKYIPSKKSLDWLSLKDNDDFKELKLGSIKSYFLEEAKLTAETIIEKASGKSVIVNIVTDTHERYWELGDVKCYDETFNNIKYVNSMVESNLLVHLGDVLMSGQTSSGKYDDNEIVKAHLGKFFDRMRDAKSKSAILLGNHDGIYGGMPDAKAIYPSISVYSAGVRYKNRPFFYSTDSDKLVRCVFLCCPYSWDGKSDWAFGEEQINWLITEALNVGNNYHVIFFTHTPLYTNDMVNSDYKDIEGVINAFNNHTSFTTSYNQVADFTGKSGTKSVALICGHEHCDLVVTDNSYFTRYNLCCPIVIIANNYRFGGTGSIPNAVYYNESQRKNGTVNQDLWDTLVYRKDLSKLYMIRFGAGEDREIDV